MADDHISTYGFDSNKRSGEYAKRTLFFATLLLLTHLLNIKPSEIDAGGLKIAIDDVAVVHGGLALLFFYYFFNMSIAGLQGTLLLPLDARRAMLKSSVRSARKPFRDPSTKRQARRTPKQVKRGARGALIAFDIIAAPFYLVVTAIVMLGFVAAVYDTYELGSYALRRYDAERDAQFERDVAERVKALESAANALQNASDAVNAMDDSSGEVSRGN